MRSLQLFGLTALVAVTLHGQVFYTNPAPDCSDVEGTVTIYNSAGTTILGYSCYVAGTFVWFAAGGPPSNTWSSAIRAAAPLSAPVEADIFYYDVNGNNLSVDTTLGPGGAVTSGNEVTVPLYANQPLEVDLLGATSNAPSYNVTETGSVYAEFYCPDETTCEYVSAQLLYSALPSIPWSLSVPLAWDNSLWPTYSAEGIDDGGSHRVSFVIYNQGETATEFTIYVYDGSGNLVGTGTTPSIPPYSSTTGQGGTYGALLSQVVTTKLPSGVFKVLFDGGTAGEESSVEVLQFTGASATAIDVAYDISPTLVSADASALRRPGSRTASKVRQRRTAFYLPK
jgi:hypothetical protein